MPLLSIAGTIREIDLIVFDKDGTLVDFDLLWSGKLVTAVEAVLGMFVDMPRLRGCLFATLGIEPDAMKVIPESPLAVSTLAKLGMATAIVLYQNGIAWHEAERTVRDVFMPAIEALPQAKDIMPLGNVRARLEHLGSHGFRLAIFTSDDRHATEACLPMLGITDLIQQMVCGDDAVAGKPSGEGLRQLGRHFGIAPEKTLMIGDSVTDMMAAKEAGVGWRVAVLSGTGRHDDLARIAHVVTTDIHALEAVARTPA